ncbi:12406_t:CDS:2 [Funneliformis mosseae]|uniref:12406_t:CDS:1 n=1 Tax=Funneliformis mosseae TaxID=27381 RepID=A0A9N8VFY8_FUNMO|nr:12406_t:CDS:2 [Funneliformis mosseae]
MVDVFHDSEHVCKETDKVIRQIFTYMSETCCQPLTLESTSPTILKVYTYVIMQLCRDYYYHHLNVIDDGMVTHSNKKRSMRSSIAKNQKSQDSAQNFSFMNFTIKGLLGRGRSGKIFLCEYRRNTIALKGIDLSKAPSYVLKEMLNEVEIYKILADIQGKYIPKLVCHGYYRGGMYYVIGTTLFESIHNHGVLHNDIRKENILFDNNTDGAYLIDFGMACYYPYTKEKLFDEERLNLSRLLDH